MYKALVNTIIITSSGIALEEEHLAREVIARWNIEKGEKHGNVFITIPNNNRGITPDIFIFVIDNFVDEQKVETAIATGSKVILLFRSHHDVENTLESEIKLVEEFRKKVRMRCVCVDYYNGSMFVKELEEELSKLC